jgi:hypothetical protein
MKLEQLMGKYARLRRELELVYAKPLFTAGRSGWIDRVARELLEVERQLGTLQARLPGPRSGPAAPHTVTERDETEATSLLAA